MVESGFLPAAMAWCISVEQDAVLTGVRQVVWVSFENPTYAVSKLVFLLIFSLKKYLAARMGASVVWDIRQAQPTPAMPRVGIHQGTQGQQK
jgi:hypothetical protein